MLALLVYYHVSLTPQAEAHSLLCISWPFLVCLCITASGWGNWRKLLLPLSCKCKRNLSLQGSYFCFVLVLGGDYDAFLSYCGCFVCMPLLHGQICRRSLHLSAFFDFIKWSYSIFLLVDYEQQILFVVDMEILWGLRNI